MTKSMEQIHRIKELQLQQKGPYQIARELGMDPKTVRKYMAQEDFSPPTLTPETRPSKLDPYKATVQAWLKADKQNRRKQRHTGKRVYDRLKQEFPEFPCSYPTVNRYVRSLREQQHLSRNGFLELEWHPGEAQADFGECDIILNDVCRPCRYLVVSFPQSNAAFVQCFLGETAECLCQGLMDIFQHIRGVPRRLVIDNASAAGRRIGELVRLTQLFKRFQAHFGFEVTFCNPDSGHEKGNVENKVGYVRRNYFVPIPPMFLPDLYVMETLTPMAVSRNEIIGCGKREVFRLLFYVEAPMGKSRTRCIAWRHPSYGSPLQEASSCYEHRNRIGAHGASLFETLQQEAAAHPLVLRTLR